jgi:hypothetical protein
MAVPGYLAMPAQLTEHAGPLVVHMCHTAGNTPGVKQHGDATNAIGASCARMAAKVLAMLVQM